MVSQDSHVNGNHSDYRTVKDLANGKRLDPSLLKQWGVKDKAGGGIFILYFDETGQEIFRRERGTGNSRFKQPAGVGLQVYGQWLLEQARRCAHLYLCEGESDTWSVWAAGYPALGLPGTSAAETITAEHLVGIDSITLLPDNDDAGAKLGPDVLKHLQALGSEVKLYRAAVPPQFKDVSDWRARDPALFKDELTAATRERELVEPAAKLEPEEWPDPFPLDEIPAVEPFPLGVLPELACRLVEEISSSMNCMPDLAALPLLTLASGAIGNSRMLQIHDTYLASALLYAVAIAEPGQCKTPPLKLLQRPLEQAQGRYVKEWKDDVKTWKKKQKDSDSDSDSEPEPKPTLRRCLVGNITTECLALKLQDNPRGLLMIRNELSGLLCGMNQYKRGGDDRPTYVELWDSQTILVDRKSDTERDGEPLFVRNAFLSIYGTTQPDRLDGLRLHGGPQRSPVNDGFLERWLPVAPEKRLARGLRFRSVSTFALTGWKRAVDGLLDLKMNKTEEGD
jgi:hypothetical protein